MTQIDIEINDPPRGAYRNNNGFNKPPGSGSRSNNSNGKDHKEAALILSGIAGLSFLFSTAFYKFSQYDKERLYKTQAEIVYTPLQLHQKLLQEYPPSGDKKVKDVKCGKYFVAGLVGFPSEGLLSLHEKKQMVFKETEIQDIMVRISHMKQNALTTDYTFKTKSLKKEEVKSFYLSENNNHVQIEQVKNSQKLNVLGDTGFKEVNSGRVEADANQVPVGQRKTFGPCGNRITEQGILVGDQLTVYGDVLYNPNTMQVIFRKPKILAKDKKVYEKQIKEKSSSKSSWFVVFLGSGIIFSVFAFHEACQGFGIKF